MMFLLGSLAERPGPAPGSRSPARLPDDEHAHRGSLSFSGVLLEPLAQARDKTRDVVVVAGREHVEVGPGEECLAAAPGEPAMVGAVEILDGTLTGNVGDDAADLPEPG